MGKEFNAHELLSRYSLGICTDEEKRLVEAWHLEELSDKRYDLNIDELTAAQVEVRKKIGNTLNKRSRVRAILPWQKLTAAAVVFIIFSLGVYFYMGSSEAILAEKSATEQEIAPGGNKAVLTLAGGETIQLSDEKEGIVIDKSGIKYNDGDTIGSLLIDDKSNKSASLNSLSTPIGGQYSITLSDGTKVWLNAASTLHYPDKFDKKERLVELRGEAYFEVASNKQSPFKVYSDGQVVEVLGTHFNISAYPDEAGVKTTLLEGSVRVSSSDLTISNLLKPNQQSFLLQGNRNGFSIKSVDTEPVIAWKNGNFMFNDEGFESIMRRVSKWYDVEIIYKSKPENISFIGTVSRSRSISEVLHAMERTGKVSFRIEGRKIVVL